MNEEPKFNGIEIPPQSGSIVEHDHAESEDFFVPLHTGRQTAALLLNEKPEHRMYCDLKLAGVKPQKIAQHFGVTATSVNMVLRQPWAREYMAKEIAKHTPDGLQQVIAHAAADSIYTLIDLRDDEDSPAAVRKACATDILDRYLGKPKQSLELSQRANLEKLSDAELAAMLPTANAEGSRGDEP